MLFFSEKSVRMYSFLCKSVIDHFCFYVCSGCKSWSNAMEILDEKDGMDTELLVYAMTLINKVHDQYYVFLMPDLWHSLNDIFVLNINACLYSHLSVVFLQTLAGLPDQDSFYDVVDSLEEQNMEAVAQRHISRKGTDLDLVEQFNIYEVSWADQVIQLKTDASGVYIHTNANMETECARK